MNKPKTNTWLWIILIIVIVVAAGYFGWRYLSGRATPTASPSPTDELTSLENDLKKVDADFDQLDKIDASQDEAPAL
jgi:predicted negative regulator of RcsB-dependent stress response